MDHKLDEEIERIKERKLKEMVKVSLGRKEKVLHLNSTSFKEILRNELRPILVDFWAEWCTPCKLLSPVFEKLAEKYSDKILFAKVNVDECSDLAEEYGIMAIPTLILFANGMEVERVVGLVPERRIESLIKKYLA